MPRRFNYTRRKKIAVAHAPVSIRTAGAEIRFDAILSLADYRLPGPARIFVEAYRGATASWQRFDFGTVEAQNPAEPLTGVLTEFGTPDGILFRVKVVDGAAGVGRLLAAADQIRPVSVDGDTSAAKSLLNTMPFDLNGEAWRVEFPSDRNPPTLLIDPKAGGKDFARTPEFRALAAPAVMRDILTRYVVIDDAELDDEDETDIRGRWVRFAETIGGPFPGFKNVEWEARDEWVKTVVTAFARREKMVDAHFLTRLEEAQA